MRKRSVFACDIPPSPTLIKRRAMIGYERGGVGNQRPVGECINTTHCQTWHSKRRRRNVTGQTFFRSDKARSAVDASPAEGVEDDALLRVGRRKFDETAAGQRYSYGV